MAGRVEKLVKWFQTTVTDYQDPRSADWWLCCSLAMPLGIVAVYLLFVFVVGPRFMARRQPYKIEGLVAVYNAAQVAACFYVAWGGAREMFRQNYSVWCQPVNHAVNEDTAKVAQLVYAYYVIKITDLLDTVFFVLRKKYNQVSFLHVNHHACMIIAGYVGCRFSLNGHFVPLGVLNSFVHVIMYSYYLYTSLFPGEKVALWVKKSLTTLQITQFCVLAVHGVLPLFQPSCGVQRIWCVILYTQYVWMSALFLDFYQKAYCQPKKQKAA